MNVVMCSRLENPQKCENTFNSTISPNITKNHQLATFRQYQQCQYNSVMAGEKVTTTSYCQLLDKYCVTALSIRTSSSPNQSQPTQCDLELLIERQSNVDASRGSQLTFSQGNRGPCNTHQCTEHTLALRDGGHLLQGELSQTELTGHQRVQGQVPGWPVAGCGHLARCRAGDNKRSEEAIRWRNKRSVVHYAYSFHISASTD